MNRNCINNARLVWLIALSPKFVIFLPSFCRAGHPTLEGSSALFLNGLCCWPGCDAVFEEFPRFLKWVMSTSIFHWSLLCSWSAVLYSHDFDYISRHLHSDHGHGDRSIAQWRVQQDMVQYMETQVCSCSSTHSIIDSFTEKLQIVNTDNRERL